MANKYRVAILGHDSGASLPDTLLKNLKEQHFDTKAYKVFGRLVNAVKSNDIDCVLIDSGMENLGGYVMELRDIYPVIPIVAITSSDIAPETVVSIYKSGVTDLFISGNAVDITGCIKPHIRKYRLWRRVHRHAVLPRETTQPPFLCGISESITSVRDTLANARETHTPAIIQGPAGCMAADIARLMHRSSGLDEFSEIILAKGRLQRDQLFGGNGKNGILHSLDTTIFLYPSEELSVESQAMIMRLWQNGMFTHQRLRLVFHYTESLEKLLADGKLLPAFYNEMNRLTMKLLPLEERREDIPHIACSYLQHFSDRYNKYFVDFSLPAIEHLYQYPWPGDMAQLRDEIDRIVYQNDAPKITSEMLSSALRSAFENGSLALMTKTDSAGEDALRPLSDVIAEYLEHALQVYDGNVEKTAKALGIGRATLYRKIERHGLRRDDV